MLMSILAAASALLVTAFLLQTLVIAVQVRRREARFRAVSSIKIAEEKNIFGDHTDSIVLNPRNCTALSELFKKYGDTFAGFYCGTDRFGVASVDLDFIKRMIFDENQTNRVNNLGLPMDELQNDTILFAEDEQWHRIRKFTAPAFSAHKIKQANVQAEIEGCIGKLVDGIEFRLHRNKSRTGDSFIVETASDLFQRFTIDLVFTCFYKQDKLIEYESDQCSWLRIIKAGYEFMTTKFMIFSIRYKVFGPILEFYRMNFHEQGKMTSKIMEFIEEQTRQNWEARQQVKAAMDKGDASFDKDNFVLKDGTKFRRNMIDYLTDKFHEGKLTRREYFHTAFFLLNAANSTTADTLNILVYHLALHQDIQTKLRDLVREEGVESDYLGWCINESMRLYPAAPIGCTRTLSKDMQTKDGLVPAGTVVLTPTYTIHRLKQYWGQDADEFRPERWADAKSFHPCQFLAFGAGKRGCPGKDLAIHEMRMLLSTLLVRYQFDHVEDAKNKLEFQSPFLMFTVYDHPIRIKISRL